MSGAAESPTPTVLSAAPLSPQAHRTLLLVLSGVFACTFISSLSSNTVSNALPRVLSDLHGGLEDSTLVVGGYLLTLTVSIPIWGRLADVYDQKMLFQIGLISFLLFSVTASVSVAPWMLIASRAAQGVASGGLSTLCQTTVGVLVPPRDRGRYTAYNGFALAAGTLGGPVIGGTIVDTSWLGWRAIFLVTLPFGVAAGILLQRRLKIPALTDAESAPIDVAGAVLVVLAVAPFIALLSVGAKGLAWLPSPTLTVVAFCLVMTAFLALAERRAARPIVPYHLFRLPTVALSAIAGIISGAIGFAAPVVLAEYLEISRGLSPARAGLALLPFILSALVAILVGGRLISRWGTVRPILIFGAIAQLAGSAMLWLVGAHSAAGYVASALAVLGVGFGIMQQHLLVGVQNAIRLSEMGAGTALISFSRFFGAVIGIAVFGAIMKARVGAEVIRRLGRLHQSVSSDQATRLPDLSTLSPSVRSAYASAYSSGTSLVFAIAALVAIAALACVSLPRGAS